MNKKSTMKVTTEPKKVVPPIKARPPLPPATDLEVRQINETNVTEVELKEPDAKSDIRSRE